MASRVYCTNVAEELEVWSARLHNLSSEIDHIPSIDKYKLLPQIEKLHIIMTEMDDRLCDLLSSCSTVETPSEEKKYTATGKFTPVGAKGGTDESFDYDFGG